MPEPVSDFFGVANENKKKAADAAEAPAAAATTEAQAAVSSVAIVYKELWYAQGSDITPAACEMREEQQRQKWAESRERRAQREARRERREEITKKAAS